MPNHKLENVNHQRPANTVRKPITSLFVIGLMPVTQNFDDGEVSNNAQSSDGTLTSTTPQMCLRTARRFFYEQFILGLLQLLVALQFQYLYYFIMVASFHMSPKGNPKPTRIEKLHLNTFGCDGYKTQACAVVKLHIQGLDQGEPITTKRR